MARGITENDVHGAADRLLGAGRRPTAEEVRAELGTGSMSTITTHLQSWWSRLAERQAAVLDHADQDSVVDGVRKLLGKAMRDERAKVALEVARLNAALETAQAELQKAIAANAQLAKDHAAALAEAEAERKRLVFASEQTERVLTEKTARVDELERFLSQRTSEVGALESKLTKANQRAENETGRLLKVIADLRVDDGKEKTELRRRLQAAERKAEALQARVLASAAAQRPRREAPPPTPPRAQGQKPKRRTS